MKLLNFTLIKLTLCLTIGICIGYAFTIPLRLSVYISSLLLFTLFISYLIARHQFTKTIWFGLICFITTISIGISTYNLHDQKQFLNHYTKYIAVDESVSKPIMLRVRKQLKSGTYYHKYIVDVLQVDTQNTLGKTLLNIQKDSLFNKLKVDEIIITDATIKDLISPLNPNQFDYKNYLKKQYIYHQIFAKNSALYKVQNKPHTIFGYAAALRQLINIKLKAYNFNPDELAIINALILGQRQDLSKEIYNNYTNAGAVHILAVSGLHIGIILYILNFLFKPIEYLKHGKFHKAALLVIILWVFAIIAGLSASVTRAVTMFSIVTIALHLQRLTNIYNTLAISIFVLLLFKPLFLLDVGFQMSYLAVIAIVYIQPLLYKLWIPKYKAVNFIWNIFTVTIAAQFGVIPISLYYFHQFPSLFFISNLLIIPFLGLVLGFGILIIVLALLNALPNWLAYLYETIISWMNWIVKWVSHQDDFLFKDLPFNLLQVISTYIFILFFMKWYKHKKPIYLKYTLIAILLFQGVFIYTMHKHSSSEFIIFHKSRYSILTKKNGKNLTVFHNLDSVIKPKTNIIKNYKVGNYIDTVSEHAVSSVYIISEKPLLIIDSLGVYNVKSFQPHYIMLRNSPRINLTRLIDSINPKVIIADGSNYKSYIKRWKATCKTKKIPFHQTSEKGAFIIK